MRTDALEVKSSAEAVAAEAAGILLVLLGIILTIDDGRRHADPRAVPGAAP